ncbi:MAG: hypothetical protein V7721_03640 [Porticoccaceae bacterium]
MSGQQFKVPTKPFQEKIRLASKLGGPKGRSKLNLPAHNQLILELLGLTPADAEKIYGEKAAIPDSSVVGLKPKAVRAYYENLEAYREWFIEGLHEIDACKKVQLDSCKARKSRLMMGVDLIDKVQNNTRPVGELFLSQFRAEWIESLQEKEACWASSNEIVWKKVTKEGDANNFRCIGGGALQGKLEELLQQKNDGHQTVLLLLPLPTDSDGVSESYVWHFLKANYGGGLSQHQAMAVLMALQLLNGGEFNAKLRDILTDTQLATYFDLLPHYRDGKDEAYIFTSAEVSSPGGTVDAGAGKLLRVKSNEGQGAYSTKKLYTDIVKREEDIHHVAFNLALIAGQTNGLVFELKLPNLKPIKNKDGGFTADGNDGAVGGGADLALSDISIYAPRFWAKAITPTAATIKNGALSFYARADFAKAYKKGMNPNDTDPKYLYDLSLPGLD